MFCGSNLVNLELVQFLCQKGALSSATIFLARAHICSLFSNSISICIYICTKASPTCHASSSSPSKSSQKNLSPKASTLAAMPEPILPPNRQLLQKEKQRHRQSSPTKPTFLSREFNSTKLDKPTPNTTANCEAKAQIQPPVKQISQPISQPISKSISKPISGPISKPISKPITKSIFGPIFKSISKSIFKPISKSSICKHEWTKSGF